MNLSYAAKPPILPVKITDSNLKIKWSDRLCKVVELSTQCYRKLLSDSFETYYNF